MYADKYLPKTRNWQINFSIDWPLSNSWKLLVFTVALLWSGHLVWKNNGSIELADFLVKIEKNKALKCYNRNFDWYSTKRKKIIKTLNNLFWENGSINFLKFYFAVRRIITIVCNCKSSIQYTEIRENPFEIFRSIHLQWKKYS